MFALPGVLLLVLFLLARPLDLFPALRNLPVLYLLAALALFGFFADVRLRFTELRFPRQFGWATCFMVWCLASAAVFGFDSLQSSALTLVIAFLAYTVLAAGVRTLKSLEWIAGGLLGVALFIGAACIHMAQQPTQCVAYRPGETRLADLGHPDGRLCEKTQECIEGGDEANAYSCERAGWFGVTSVDRRVRHVGTLQDPNEVALFVSSTLPFAVAFYRRRRTAWRAALAAASGLVVGATVYYTQSRSGLLVLLFVLAAVGVQRFGVRRALRVGMLCAVPLGLLLLTLVASLGRADAQDSTDKRVVCMWSGLQMFRSSPFVGVGFDQFTNHHEQTAHNSYVLAAAELGVPGLLLWTMTFYLAFKSVAVALRLCRGPEAEAARVWGGALVISLLGLAVGMFFLSLTYHYVVWIFFGLAGAFASAVRAHERRFEVPVGWRDLVLVLAGVSFVLTGVFLYTWWKLQAI